MIYDVLNGLSWTRPAEIIDVRWHGYPPLMHALHSPEAALLLLRFGADPNVRGSCGRTAEQLHASLHASEYASIITLESWQVELSPEMQRAVGYTVSPS